MKKAAQKCGSALTHVVNFRVTDVDVLRLQALATIRNANTSELLREMIRREVALQVSKGRTVDRESRATSGSSLTPRRQSSRRTPVKPNTAA